MSANRTHQILVGATLLVVDFALLQEQKKFLLGLAADPRAEGLIELLNGVQDAAEEALGLEGSEVVFGRSRK